MEQEPGRYWGVIGRQRPPELTELRESTAIAPPNSGLQEKHTISIFDPFLVPASASRKRRMGIFCGREKIKTN
jgi:hypothetical protein